MWCLKCNHQYTYISKGGWLYIVSIYRTSGLVIARSFPFIHLCILFCPQVTRNVFALVSCREMDVGYWFLEDDLDVACYSPRHIQWLMYIGLPCLIAYVIGLPTVALLALRRRRFSLSARSTLFTYGFLVCTGWGRFDCAMFLFYKFSVRKICTSTTSSTML